LYSVYNTDGPGYMSTVGHMCPSATSTKEATGSSDKQILHIYL